MADGIVRLVRKCRGRLSKPALGFETAAKERFGGRASHVPALQAVNELGRAEARHPSKKSLRKVNRALVVPALRRIASRNPLIIMISTRQTFLWYWPLY